MKHLLSILTISFFLLSSCDSWLDVVPEEDMTTLDTEFETRDVAEDWLRSCYMFLQKTIHSLRGNEAFLGADELVGGDYIRSITDSEQTPYFKGFSISSGLQNALNPLNDYWSRREGSGKSDYYTAINMCNIFISKIDQVYNMENREKREWKAEVQALKAYFYFELVRHYGPIILVPENIDPNVPVAEMQIPRSHVDTCFQAIVDLCDEAAQYLSPFKQKESSRRTYFNKEAALALKARALLYQASPLFNGNRDFANFVNKNGEPLFNTTEEPEKWRRAAEAAEAAIEVCLQNGKHLVEDQVGSTKLLTHMLNIEASTKTFNYTGDEVLLMLKGDGSNGEFFPYTLPRTKTGENNLAGTCISPSMKMVEMFYTDNGLPIEQDQSYGGGNIYGKTKVVDPIYSDVVIMNEDIPYLHTRREPRFYANIAAGGCYWRLGLAADNLYRMDVFRDQEFGVQQTRISQDYRQNLTGYFLKKWTYSNASLHNYERDVKALGVRTYPVFRVAELYMIAAEAWNEYEGPTSRVRDNLNKIRSRAGIPNVEVSWTMAKDKNKVSNKDGMREIIRQEWNIEFAFEGMRFWNLRRWKTAHLELNEKLYGWIVTGNDYDSFYNNGKGPVVVNADNKFISPRDYFWPIRSEETLISGCVQNLGW